MLASVHVMLRRTVTAALLAGVLLAPPAASADAFDDVFADFRRDERIDPCRHSEGDLRSARAQVPSDIEQYAPDLPDALDVALEARARGACDEERPATQAAGASAATTASPPPAGAAPGTPATVGGASSAPAAAGTVPQPPGTAQAAPVAADGAIVNAAAVRPRKGGDDVPAAVVVLAVLGGLLALGLLAWGLARFFAWDPRWLAGARHAIAEAGWRTSGAWDDFSDWLRRGRTASSR